MRVEACLAGLALGLLTGVLVGLSTTPVVAGVVSAITALLAGFFAFGQNISPATLWRVAGFGMGGVVGLTCGLFVRAGDLAAPSPKAELERWTSAGYPTELAQDVVLFSRYGIAPRNRTTGPLPVARREASGLFSDVTGICERVQMLPAEGSGIADTFLQGGQAGARRQLVVQLLRERRLTGAEVRTLLCDN